MSQNAANEEKLGSLHAAVADVLIDQLAAEELDPRVIASAITFLNNNKITASPFLEEKMSEIEERLAERKRKKGFQPEVVPSEAAKRAAEAI